MRFHSLVLSVISGTPCCIISYSDKIDDIISRLELEKYAVRVSPIPNLYYESEISFDIVQFQRAFRSMIEDEEQIKNNFLKATEGLHYLSMKNWDLVERIIKRAEHMKVK